MIYLVHETADLEKMQKEIIPLLDQKDHELLSHPLPDDFKPGENDLFLLYLSDSNLKDFLSEATHKDFTVSILPHEENKTTSQGLGISENAEEVISQIDNEENLQELDMLYCNEEPVFQAVSMGEIFLLTGKPQQNGFFSEVMHIIKNIRRVSSLSHHSYQISSDGDKIINTSALGIVVVEHAYSSVISKKLVSETSVSDGYFHAFVLAPQNLLTLLWFFIRSLVPGKKKLDQQPSFMGSIKASNLEICNAQDIEYTIDGIKHSSEKLCFRVDRKALKLRQKSIYSGDAAEENGKKSLKIEGLPTGETKNALIKRNLPILPRASTEQFEDLFKVLRENSTISWPFMMMMILSTLIASFGLFADSSPVIIGAMILAPIISPIVSFSMGMVRYEVPMLKRGLSTITVGTLVSLAFAAGVSLIIPLKIVTPEIEARLSPTLLDMGIAVASGIAAAYAHAKEGIAKSLAGVAIAVALVPPLAVAGIGIGWWDWEVFSGAILLYATNLAGIIMFAGLTFLLLGFAPFKRAKMGLIYTFIIIIMVTFPLSLSFDRIMQEATITQSLEGTTIENTVLRDVRIRFGKPIVVSLRLVGPEAMEPEKIHKIKEEIEDRIEEKVILEVVSAMEF